MLILGLSAFEHDPAAALFSDGTPLAAIEERKLTRLPARGLPQAAIRYCLSKAGVDWRGVGLIASATRPWSGWISKSSFHLRRAVRAPIAGAYSSARELGVLLRELSNSRRLAEVSGVHRSKVLSLDHHDCHAASAFYASSFDRALIITMDEEGDGCSCAVALGVGNEIHALRRIPFPHSLGWVYSQVTALLGFRPHQDEHKVQWVSLEGEPVHRDVFLDMLRRPPEPHPHVNFKYFNRGLGRSRVFNTLLPQGWPDSRGSPLPGSGKGAGNQLAASMRPGDQRSDRVLLQAGAGRECLPGRRAFPEHAAGL